MTKYRFYGIVMVILFIALAIAMFPDTAGATGNHHCYPSTRNCHPTQEPTSVQTDEPTANPTEEPDPTLPPDPTEDSTETATPQPTSIYSTLTPPPTTSVPAHVTCETKCVYNLGGAPGTHAVTAVSPTGPGLYTWQVRINGVWYDVYDCNGVRAETAAESRGETSITRLIVDSSSPANADSYRVVQGAAAILFDDFHY